MTIPRLLIAGTHSGVGKTTLAVGLMAALRRRGLRVAPFKVGPDYLDPGYHRAACGCYSAPLDTWMLGEEGMRRSFASGTRDADIAIIEGMMGLHDGADARTDRGSSAQVARLLGAPVVLVLDGSALARSAGAMALGYRSFDPRVPFGGVVANRVAGEGHAAFLRPGIEEGAGLPMLGWLPPTPEWALPERNLGLVTAADLAGVNERVERLVDAADRHLDVPRLMALAAEAPGLSLPEPEAHPASAVRARIAVAQDPAFCFYYPDNLALLEAAGAELVPFSPLEDAHLPPRIDGLYLGGGYPELHAARLAQNESLRREIRSLGEDELPIFAECGGFMYLCEALLDAVGEEHPMVGLIPGRTLMQDRLQAIGYREVQLAHHTLLGPPGAMVHGHEFRYSRYVGPADPARAAFNSPQGPIGYAAGNVLASYVHLHFGSNPALIEAWMSRCVAYRGSTGFFS